MSKSTVGPETGERRSHPRIRTTFELQGGPGGEESMARMVASDLSLGGLYCLSTRDYAEMTQLSVRLELGPQSRYDDALELQAVVVRRKQLQSSSTGQPRFELALFFTSLTEDQRERISRYLALV